MNRDFLSPIVLAADQFTLPTTSPSLRSTMPAAQPNPVKFMNPNRTAMLVDEFRVFMPLGLMTDQLTMYMRIFYGATPLTNNWLPMRAFMPAYLNGSGMASNTDTSAVWHLARPLYVPPNVQLTMEFMRYSAGDTYSWTLSALPQVTCAIAGRSMPAGMAIPKTIFVPWACAYAGFAGTGINQLQTSDADIANPFDVPLHVDYFTGYAFQEFGTSPNDPTVQMTLSNGKSVVRDPTPMTLLFPLNRPILRSRALLQPKEFLSATIEWPNTTGPVSTVAAIGMTGWREMQTPKGAQP